MLGGSVVKAPLPTIGAMIAVCDISALARWGERDLALRLGPPLREPTGWESPSARGIDPQVLRAARLEATPERRLHVLVGSDEARVRAKSIRSHIWSTPLPRGALYQLTPDVLLASPRFCLQQMSPRSSLARAAALAMEVCGEYARSPRAPGGFYRRPPLEDVEALRAHFELAGGYGAGRVREALPYVAPGSRSPMETVLVLVLVLPLEVGGCGLPMPRLNFRIEIPPALQRALGKPYVVADLCWPEFMLILEYNGYEWHATPTAMDGDASRNEGLRDAGWMVREVTSGLLTDPVALDMLLGKVAARLGRELPQDETLSYMRQCLVRELMRA